MTKVLHTGVWIIELELSVIGHYLVGIFKQEPIPHVQVGCFADFVIDATFSLKPRVRIIA